MLAKEMIANFGLQVADFLNNIVEGCLDETLLEIHVPTRSEYLDGDVWDDDRYTADIILVDDVDQSYMRYMGTLENWSQVNRFFYQYNNWLDGESEFRNIVDMRESDWYVPELDFCDPEEYFQMKRISGNIQFGDMFRIGDFVVDANYNIWACWGETPRDHQRFRKMVY